MATQNLLQRLDSAEHTTGSSVNVSDRRIEEVFIASEAISAGDFVCLNLDKSDNSDKALYVKKLTVTPISSLGIGVAIAAAAADENIRVCIRGFVSANVDAGIAQGDRLVGSSVAGRADTASSFRTDLGDGTGTTTGTVAQQQSILAVAASIATANVATVFVVSNF